MTKAQMERIRGEERVPITIKMKKNRNEPAREIQGLLVMPRIESASNGIVVLANRSGSVWNRYSELLDEVRKALGVSPTSRQQLDAYCKAAFGDRYLGTFAANESWQLTRKQPYAIVNTKPPPGEHWLAVGRGRNNNRYIVYDSLGRVVKMVVDGKIQVVSTREGAEQSAEEEDCGQRAIAFLLLLDEMGMKAARQI